MDLYEAKEIYEQFQKSHYQSLVKPLIKNAVNYSRLRVEWLLMDIDGRLEIDDERSRAHNSFIRCCDALARNMIAGGEDAAWRIKIGGNRKDIGDFAVLLVAVMGIKAR
jgi:hypothetical protein